MTQSAAMVQAKVVKGAGGGAGAKMDCDAIFACFDPPVEMGPHEDMDKSRERQAEHVPPCSNMHVKGRGGAKVSGCDNYSTSRAQTWMVEDGQKLGAEHQRLTQSMREFAKANEGAIPPKNASLKEWMDEYQKAAKDVLKDRPVKTSAKHLDKDSLAAAAAECIRERVDASFAGKVDQNTPLRNGQARGKPPVPPPPRAGSASRGGRA
jgi:hypothetical protein